MIKLSEIINRVYRKYQPILEKVGISLNLDFPDTSLMIEPGRGNLELMIEKNMRAATKRVRYGDSISISIRKGKIMISDTGTVLSKAACAVLSSERVSVKSRVGFGTSVEISF